MEAREARRTAEKAARDLITTRTTLIGDLAIAVHNRDTATHGVTAARADGAKLVDAARKQAAQLLATATDAVAKADDSYATAYTAALTGGWHKTELKTMNYPAPTGRRATTNASASTADTRPPSDHSSSTEDDTQQAS
jgi:hypothetical protein